MKMITENDAESAHRIRRLATDGRPRAVIERFKSERRRDGVFKSRVILKTHNATTIVNAVWML